jgi:hypothetical protein
MEVTLEKIEIVKDRTGVEYKDAKDALEKADGSVVDAIINIEESIDSKAKKNIADQSASIVQSVKDLVKKGNVSKIVVKSNDGDVLLNLPINASIVATILAPWGVLAGVVSSFAFKCSVEVVKEDGSVVNVSEKASGAFDKAKEKGGDVIEKVKESDVVDKVKDKAEDAAGIVKDKASDAADKVKETEAFDIFKDKADDFKDFAEDKIDDLKDKAASLKDKGESGAEEVISESAEAVEAAEETAEEVSDEIE